MLTNNVDFRRVQYCNVLSDVFIYRRANNTQSTIHLASYTERKILSDPCVYMTLASIYI